MPPKPNKRIPQLDPIPDGVVVNDDWLFPGFSPETGETHPVRKGDLAGGGNGGGAFPANEPPAAISVGNVPAGYVLAGKSTTVVLRQLFSQPYQVPGFGAFNLDGQGTRTVRIGTPFPAGNKTFTWSISNGQNVAANTISIQDVTAGTTLVANTANDGTQSVNTAAFTAINGLSRRYRINATNSQGGAFSALLDINGAPESYFGYSTSPSLTGAQIVALGNPVLQNGRNRTLSGVTASGGQYTYYGYEASGGDLTSIILDGAAPVLGAFQKLGDFATTNAAGASITIRLYRSNAVNAFSNNTLAFS